MHEPDITVRRPFITRNISHFFPGYTKKAYDSVCAENSIYRQGFKRLWIKKAALEVNNEELGHLRVVKGTAEDPVWGYRLLVNVAGYTKELLGQDRGTAGLTFTFKELSQTVVVCI